MIMSSLLIFEHSNTGCSSIKSVKSALDGTRFILWDIWGTPEYALIRVAGTPLENVSSSIWMEKVLKLEIESFLWS